MEKICITLPSVEKVLNKKPCIVPRIRERRDGRPPLDAEALNQMGRYRDASGIYIHILTKQDNKRVILYVGQTGKSFRDRINNELTMENRQCSQKFIDGMKSHVGKNDVSTVFFDDDEIRKMVTVPEAQNCIPQKDSIRLLVEQAMVIAYFNDELLNVH